jgi:type IV fimbrial biogenesis protein FimT
MHSKTPEKRFGELFQQGFTLLELMIAVSILAIIITVAFPSFSDIGDTQRVIGATEQIYSHIQQVRSEALTANTTAGINFGVDGSKSWEYGFSTVNDQCDLTATLPTMANACVIVIDDGDGTLDPGDGSVDTDDLVLQRFTSTEWNDVRISIASFSSSNTQIAFDPVRGTSTSGQINLVSGNGKQLRINVSLLGRPTICSPGTQVSNYETC